MHELSSEFEVWQGLVRLSFFFLLQHDLAGVNKENHVLACERQVWANTGIPIFVRTSKVVRWNMRILRTMLTGLK